MFNPIARYTRWLHTQWPAGGVEKQPHAQPDGSTNVPGLYVVGDLTGIPLLKFSADTGARAVRTIADDSAFQKRSEADDVVDIAIVGGGVSGFAAALEAKKRGLSFKLIEAAEPFSTIVNFPKAKPIYTYPTDMTPAGELQFHAKSDVKEGLLEDLREQTLEQGIEPVRAYVQHVRRRSGLLEVMLAEDEPIKAHRVIVAIGRSGNFRKLGVQGEDLDKVYNRLHDPKDYADKRVLVVGGGDTAMETAIALTTSGAQVTLSYRKAEFSRPKQENVRKLNALLENPTADVDVPDPTSDRITTASGKWMHGEHGQGSLTLLMSSNVKAIREGEVDVTLDDGSVTTLENDVVFSMIGREAPLDFFRKSGVTIAGDHNVKWWATLAAMVLTFAFLYQWKKPGTWLPIAEFFEKRGWFPHNLGPWLTSVSGVFADPSNLLGTIALSAAGLPGRTGSSPGFWFSLMYTTLIVTFGIRRIRRRRTKYVTWQTIALMAVQVVPLFVLPYVLLPWMGHNGFFDSGVMKTVADHLFPVVEYDPHGREFWRAFGLILAWPLFLWNVFTDQPMWAWLIISLVQTFVLIPGIIFFWGKGAYCGWICSCGAMAETLGDTHRHKMPHGPVWNRMNMIGQVFLAAAMLLLVLRVLGWMSPKGAAEQVYGGLLNTSKYGGYLPGLNYAWFVDLFWAGILGFGLYFNFSGRVWCRFACPLAALMHIYARFSRFRILADKKKCISCNVCTTVCHQGIDVMNFANKGEPMADPQCVRCSACVQSCPTGVLSFGQINRRTGAVIREDPAWLAAWRVRMTEVTVNGRRR